MGGCPKFTLGGSVPPPRPPSGKILTYAQVLANICIIVNFQHCSSINAGLMQRSLCNRFALKGPPKWFLGGFWGQGLRYLMGTPRNAMTADLRRLVKKYGDALNTLVCTRSKEITKKT